jgi:pantoate--beta-alanine ligase
MAVTLHHKDDLQALVNQWQAAGERVAFVPTMGALHDGHLSLVQLAKQKADRVVVSVFVNPTQFAPHEDFDSYPRDVSGDARKLDTVGVDALYAPSAAEMYPDGDLSSAVKAGQAALGLESDFRPHFFGGVVNVVYRLFMHVCPNIAIFGEKDFQQLQVIREMVEAQQLDIEIIGALIVRDGQGLALSSRNAYLSEDELEVARQLNRILKQVACGDLAAEDGAASLLAAGFDKVDYIAQRWGRVLGAAWLGKTRLIDNVPEAL